MISQGPSLFKSNHLHVDIFQSFLYEFEVYSLNFSKMIGNFPKIMNFNRFFSQPQLVHRNNVRGEPGFSAMAAGWFCENPG